VRRLNGAHLIVIGGWIGLEVAAMAQKGD